MDQQHERDGAGHLPARSPLAIRARGARSRSPRLRGPAYKGTPERLDPEQALVAAISGCHMLTFLALSSKNGHVVKSYTDRAVGHLEKNDDGAMAITRVELRPEITFADGTAPDAEALANLHEKAHHHCFIANSVKTHVTVAG